MTTKNILQFYTHAKQEVIKAGYQKEIDFVEKRRFSDIKPLDFLQEYVYVVINSGMKNQVANKIYRQYREKGSSVIGHKGKRKAILKAQLHYRYWFVELKSNGSTEEKLYYLETLPWIGPITKYHLARNLGIDVAKPDRHLQRIADHFKYFDVQKMCNTIAIANNERIGTIDFVLWRFSILHPLSNVKDGEILGW